MKIKQIILITIVILSGIIIPTVLYFNSFYTKIEDSIDSQKLSEFATFQSFLISLWGLVLNIILVVIAYKAFKNFDVKKQFHNKQLELVSDLATDISSTILSNMLYETKIDPHGKEHLIATGFTLSFFEISIGFNYSKFESIYVASNNIENCFPFLKHRKNPLLPKSIAKELNKLYRPLQYSFAVEKDKMPKNYVKLYSRNIDEDDYSKTWLYELYKSPSHFNTDSLAIRKSIIDWFKEYGAEDINI
ncbi:hypothetical protein [Flavobacterium gelatinilyticum]|uniref:hypothetical protein n=1 Tax=Flavobacterium gelatinilyticum TaxID=3003260 RepID=UPI00247FB1D9|nr:hypothetical protein [Flavobacterium gelatinilyticum]